MYFNRITSHLNCELTAFWEFCRGTGHLNGSFVLEADWAGSEVTQLPAHTVPLLSAWMCASYMLSCLDNGPAFR